MGEMVMGGMSVGGMAMGEMPAREVGQDTQDRCVTGCLVAHNADECCGAVSLLLRAH